MILVMGDADISKTFNLASISIDNHITAVSAAATFQAVPGTTIYSIDFGSYQPKVFLPVIVKLPQQ